MWIDQKLSVAYLKQDFWLKVTTDLSQMKMTSTTLTANIEVHTHTHKILMMYMLDLF